MPPAPKKTWFQTNGTKLAVMLAGIAVVCYFLHPLDVLLVCVGLGGIIFIHELGHFLAAKLCDVYVRTFSIGFGPAWPFCEFNYGETHYKLGMIPLGGYVAMAGESTGEVNSDEAAAAHIDDDHPRSFKNKPVWQRMIIISAGVVMNVILAAVCFLVAYSSGVKEPPAIVQGVEPGGAAWQAGLMPGSTITRLNDLDKPTYLDISPEVSTTDKGQTVSLSTVRSGVPSEFQIEPIRVEGAPYPQLGLPPPQGVQFDYARRDPTPPYNPDSPADAWNQEHEEARILPGDTIEAMSDPAEPNKLTPLEPNWNGLPGATFDFRRRLAQLAGKTVRLRVKRLDSDATVEVALAPCFAKDTGLRMKMGKVTAIRTGSSAEALGLKAQKRDGEKELEPGDRIVEVSIIDGAGQKTILALDPKATGTAGATVKLLDPIRLPYELAKWADATPASQRLVSLTVLREVDHTEKRVAIDGLAWDDRFRDEHSSIGPFQAAIPIGPLGFCYRVTAEVNAVEPGSPAAEAGVQPGDVVSDVLFFGRTFKWNRGTKQHDVVDKDQSWEATPPHLWAYVNSKLQQQSPHRFKLKLQRAGEVTIQAKDDPTWPVPLAGLLFRREEQEQRAEGFADALRLGARRTIRAIKTTYQSLYSLIVGRISIKMMSGPITLARASYIVAGEDWRTLVLLCALISINLAVVNFLPVPVLDGGHMVFLIYEAIVRKPPPVLVQNILTIAGLVCVLGLMVFTVGLDLWRLFFT